MPHSVLPIFLSFFFFFKPHQAACKVLVSSCCCRRQITSVLSDSVQPHRRQPTRLPRPWDSPGKNTRVGCHFLLQCMKVKSESEVAQSCPTHSVPMDCSLTCSSLHGIFQARVLEWDAIAFSVSSRPGIKLTPPALEEQTLNHWTIREVPVLLF